MILLKNIEEQARYYRKEQKVYKYAHEFFETICKCGNITMTNSELLPLYCYNEIEEFVNAVSQDSKTAIDGGMQFVCKKQAVIRIGINGDSDILNPKLKRVIRHEIIHYFLWLMDMPHYDNDLEFWSYCYAFDGGAYEALGANKKILYDTFVRVYDERICKLPDSIKYIILQDAILQLVDITDPEEYVKQVSDSINKLKTMFHI